jgi:glycosyltransferase involved in cell wall biosynthesis
MEYMDAARPIVATRVGGVPDLVDDGVEALLVPPRDPPALAAAIGELLTDRERAAELGERARDRRRREFDIAVTAERVGQLYESLYEASPRRSR